MSREHGGIGNATSQRMTLNMQPGKPVQPGDQRVGPQLKFFCRKPATIIRSMAAHAGQNGRLSMNRNFPVPRVLMPPPPLVPIGTVDFGQSWDFGLH